MALGASVGAYGGVGVAGFSGGATAVVTVPGGALIGGAAFGYGAQVLCSKGSGGGGGGGPTVSNQSGGDFWKSLKGFRGKTKTNGGSGKERQYYERDRTHGDIEVYDSRGRHLGSADANSGTMTKPAVPGRRIEI